MAEEKETDEGAAFIAETRWRAEHDRQSRDQYLRIAVDAGFLCEGGHLENVAAIWRRSAQPHLHAQPIYYCDACYNRLPATQEEARHA